MIDNSQKLAHQLCRIMSKAEREVFLGIVVAYLCSVVSAEDMDVAVAMAQQGYKEIHAEFVAEQQ